MAILFFPALRDRTRTHRSPESTELERELIGSDGDSGEGVAKRV
jgi:hypothetical protein